MKSANMKKWDAYFAQHDYLRQTAGWQLAFEHFLEEIISPVDFPAQAEWQALTKEGVPLLQNEELQQKVAKAAAENLYRAVDAVFDNTSLKLPDAMEKSFAAVRLWAAGAEPEACRQFFTLLLRQDDRGLSDLATAHHLGETSLRLLGWGILSTLVPAAAKDVSAWEELGWKRNYCPVCGRQPVLAVLRKEQEGRARFLVCDGCHTVWPYARVGCAYCGNEDLKKMQVLEPEGEEAMRLDVCDVCHSYLKTYQGKDEHGEEEIYRHDWATLHLDILGSERNLVKKGSILLASAEGEEK